MPEINIKQDFKPAKQFEKYYLIFNLFLGVVISWLCLIWFVIPVYDTYPDFLIVYLFVITVLPVAAIGFWNGLYYNTIIYHLNETEMTWKRGVWFRQTGIVPYNRITNVDIIQGPLMRIFKISNLRIQTAGYSTQKNAEIKIQGIENAEMLRELIMEFVRNKEPVAAATGGLNKKPADISMLSNEVLTELKEIKEILKSR
ncbi:MAG: PH domain-containing protein [Methanomicrobiaceae archaeon]|nr:PH domain-containing protein [Methanomicrobiaceae archaeon]